MPKHNPRKRKLDIETASTCDKLQEPRPGTSSGIASSQERPSKRGRRAFGQKTLPQTPNPEPQDTEDPIASEAYQSIEVSIPAAAHTIIETNEPDSSNDFDGDQRGKAASSRTAEKRARNTFNAKVSRERKALWDKLPTTFTDVFKHSPQAVKNLRKASFYSDEAKELKSAPRGRASLILVPKLFEGSYPAFDELMDYIRKHSKPETEFKTIVSVESDGSVAQEADYIPWKSLEWLLIKRLCGPPTDHIQRFDMLIDIPFKKVDCIFKPQVKGIDATVGPEHDGSFTVHLGLVGKVMNFHVDTIYANIACLAGSCEKIWICAPPTLANMEVLQTGGSIATQAAKYTDLSILRQTSTHAVMLSPGMIHATVTLQTGLLYSHMYRTRRWSFGATMGLISAMREPDNNEGVALSQEKLRIVRDWMGIMDAIAKKGTAKEKGRGGFAFSLKGLDKLRREGFFKNLGPEINTLAKKHYPDAIIKQKA